MPLATQPNVEALLLRALTATEATYFAALAAMADTAIEAEAPGLTIAAGTETVDLRVGLDGELWTPRYPVTAVTSVTINGLAVTDPDFDKYGAIRAPRAFTWADKLDASWPHGAEAEVEYAYGFADPPADLELIAAEMVASSIVNPKGDVRQEQLGDHMVGWGAGANGSRVRLDDEQRRKVRRYRRQITSLPIDRAGP